MTKKAIEGWTAEKKHRFVMTILLVMILAVNLFYVTQKSGYYTDEGMTLFLANGHYNGAVTAVSDKDIGDFFHTYVWKKGEHLPQAITNVRNMLFDLRHVGNYSEEGSVAWYDDARSMIQGHSTWILGKTLFDEVTTQKGARFQYGQLYLNQAMDVHPLVYYILVHTVFSLVPGIYSDYLLWAINMLFLLATCVVIDRLVRKLTEKADTALFAVIIYGFSQGFVSCAVYFRMYAVLSFWVLLSLYWAICIKEEPSEWLKNKENRRRVCLTVLLGFHTHYYYIVFFAPLFFITCYRVWNDRVIRKKYIMNLLLTGLLSVVIWPFSLYHILFGYRGTEAVSNVFAKGFFQKLNDCLDALSTAFFGGNVYICYGILLCSGIYLIGSLWNRKGTKKDTFFLELVVPIVIYLVVVIQVAPTVSDRYFMCLFSVFAIYLALGLMGILHVCVHDPQKKKGIFWLSVGLIIGINAFCMKPNYLYLEQKKYTLGIKENKSEYNGLMVGMSHGQGFSEVFKLCEFEQVNVVGMDELDLDQFSFPENQKDTIIYIFDALDVDEIAQKLGATKEIASDIDCFRAYVRPAEL